MQTNLRVFLLGFALLSGSAACGAKTPAKTGAAALKFDITFPAPDLRAYAANETADVLTKLTPQSLLVLVCDHVTLSNAVKVFCAESANDFNYKILFTDFNAGAGTATEVPPGVNQVVVLQGRSADNSVTYQGFATLPTIEPRATYELSVEMKQVFFPDLPRPEAPILLEPAAQAVTVPPTAVTFEFKGTRVADTFLRVISPPSFNLGNRFGGDEPPAYDETILGDGTIEWTLSIELPTDRSLSQSYAFSFEVSRTGEEKYSTKVNRTIKLCSDADPACAL
jgi:hypothetical protein